jgi:hypothetical protein
MWELFLNALTVGITLLTVLFAVLWTTSLASDARHLPADEKLHIRLGQCMILLAIATSLFMQTGMFWVLQAWRQGEIWGSHWVFNLPSMHDFWAYFLPSHLSGRSMAYAVSETAAALTDVAGAFFLAIGIAVLLRLFSTPSARRKLREASKVKLIVWCLGHIALYLAAFEIILFLTAYLVGTIVFLTGFFWAFVILLILGLVGGGQTVAVVYDRDGNKIGRIDRY